MSAQRRIRSLHLAAPEERWIRRGAFLVEDALRTASLPWADTGRLLLVRAVDLGVIPAGAAPAVVALALERRLRELALVSVHAARPDAPRAAAVWFRDAAEAHALLAAKLARGEEAAAWFWPLAVPAWRPGTPRREAVRALLLGVLETPAGPAAALELVRALREAGGLDLLASALTPEDGPWLLRACGWRVPEEGGDARAAWWRAMLRAVDRGALPGAVSLPRPAGGPHPPTPSPIAHPSPGRGGAAARELSPSRVGRTARTPVGGGTRQGTDDGPAGLILVGIDNKEGRGFPPLPGEGCAMGEGGQGGEDQEAAGPTELPSSLARPFPPPAVHPDSYPSPARGREGDRADTGQPRPAADFTRFAGLFFLLPVLARLGLAGFLEDHPHLLDAGFPARLLDHVARRLGAAADDPIRQILPIPEDGEPEEAEDLRKSWLTGLRRWCRRRAGIGLASLVRRPGQVISTRTYVDVFLDPRRVEMRVRRAGLDLDPGWVPWLGRVVLFHYAQPPEVLDAG